MGVQRGDRGAVIEDHDTLHVIAIVRDATTVRLIERTLGAQHDELSIATDLAEGLARAASEAPDLLLVDVAMGDSAGLAVVHHVRAVAPDVAIYALARHEDLELGTQAVALGGNGVLMLPLSGDELLSALSAVRTRRAERRLRMSLEREVVSARLATRLLDGLEASSECATRREAARRVLDVFMAETGASAGAVFLRASDTTQEVILIEKRGDVGHDLPNFCDDMALMGFADAAGLQLVRLASRASQQGNVLLQLPAPVGPDELRAMERAGAHASTSIALAAEREEAGRGTMKDPESSAYTFAYFVDVAGREIDKARRHGRRFALATLTVGEETDASHSIEAAERILAAVRDTDILARVDTHEFHLLLPETGGIGAHTCRRRIIRELKRLHGGPIRGLTIGVSTYPHDGSDLSQLLRVAGHRAEASRRSAVFELGLEKMPLDEVLDTLLWTSDPPPLVEAPRAVALPRADIVAMTTAAVGEARRSGAAWVVANEHSGVNLGSAVRAALGPPNPALRFDGVDLGTVQGNDDLEVVSLIAEHAAYTLIGRADGEVVRAVHSADPLFADFIVERLGEAAGTRLWD